MKTTFEITQYLDQFVIGQMDAKRAIAVSYRERALRLENTGEEWRYVVPNNILMIGPSGVGKTELARQMAELTNAPFIKVEITEFTQVGYFGRDVKTILSDLVTEAVRIAPSLWKEQSKAAAPSAAVSGLTRKLFLEDKDLVAKHLKVDPAGLTYAQVEDASNAGKLNKLIVPASYILHHRLTSPSEKKKSTFDDIMEEMGLNFGGAQATGDYLIYQNFAAMCIAAAGLKDKAIADHLQTLLPNSYYSRLSRRPKLTESYVNNVIMAMAPDKLKDIAIALGKYHKTKWGDLVKTAKVANRPSGDIPDDFIVRLVEDRGIIFIDEIDKIFVDKSGGNVGNIGVVRDLLPYLDGVTLDVPMQGEREQYYGNNRAKNRSFRINTANILWIASGAFNIAKVSDVPAEILGRLPVHVRLQPLDKDSLYQILNKPHGSVIAKLKTIMGAEGVDFDITDEAVKDIAQLAFDCNQRGEDIGARRLINISSVLFDQLRYDASNMPEDTKIVVDSKFIAERAKDILEAVPVRVPRHKPVNTESAVLNSLADLLRNR